MPPGHGTGVEVADDEELEALRQRLGYTAEAIRVNIEMAKIFLGKEGCKATVCYLQLPPSLHHISVLPVLYVESSAPCSSGEHFADRRRMSCTHDSMCSDDEKAAGSVAYMVRSFCGGTMGGT